MAYSEKGDAARLGASLDDDGTANFAVVSDARAHGDGYVVVSVFTNDGEEMQYPLWAPSDDHPNVWSAKISGLTVGQRYGFRVCGDYNPAAGTFYDPRLLLSDPYARAFTPNPVEPRRPFCVLPSRVTSMQDHNARPATPLQRTVIYETNVRSLTLNHPEVPPRLRGTYASVAHPALIEHFHRLGVTAIELLPVQQHVTEQRLLDRGLSNLWGYSTLGFFAPDFRYSGHGSLGGQVGEFQRMAADLHAAGLEVILDVDYNHTAEGGVDQPALCWRGLANDLYYLLDPHDRSRYVDVTGCGNTLNFGSSYVTTMVIDSLRYWVEQMHVDGFRFDLATVLLRHDGAVDDAAPFLVELRSALPATVKLIAEPWDSGKFAGYQLGHFPAPWTQWNDRFRDATRSFWLCNTASGEIRQRLAGSPDLIADSLRQSPPDTAFVNYVTSHDGRTAFDLVSYATTHNEANQDIGDGPAETAINHGTEGPSTDLRVELSRLRDIRALVAMTLIARGVPMLLGGDELLRSQRGNNNAYCQDNPISWYDWTIPEERQLATFINALTTFRRDHPTALQSWGNDAPPGALVWSQPTLGSGSFLGLVCRCPADDGDEHEVAVVINSSDADLNAYPPVGGAAVWTIAWSSATDDLPEPAERLLAPARSVVGAFRNLDRR